MDALTLGDADTTWYMHAQGMHYAYTLSFVYEGPPSTLHLFVSWFFLNSIKPESGQRTERRFFVVRLCNALRIKRM